MDEAVKVLEAKLCEIVLERANTADQRLQGKLQTDAEWLTRGIQVLREAEREELTLQSAMESVPL